MDVIHTNSGTLLDAAVSLPEPVGQVDFYPNGGTHQAGCTDLCIGWACINWDFIDFFKFACSHKRAHKYYIESISNPNAFLSTACESYEDFQNGDCGDHALKVPMGEILSASL